MPRYIDADLEVSDYVTVWDCDCSEFGKQTVMAVGDLQYLPTAEVVPKSEVDRLNAVMKDMDEQRAYTINMLGENLENAKAEVERLQAENETLKDNNEHLAVMLEEAKTEANRYKRYYFHHDYDKMNAEAKQEAAREIFYEIERVIYECDIIDLAELKKKYTEEKT